MLHTLTNCCSCLCSIAASICWNVVDKTAESHHVPVHHG